MLTTVLSSMPTFAMTCFELPVSLCKQIQSALIRFWWDSSDTKKSICWVSWDKITMPKSMGGLGFRDIQQFNKALLGKLAWRILTKPNCLLARTLLGKYCHSRNFLNTPCSPAASHGWRGIIEGRDVLIQHLGKVIGNGNSTKLWHEPWISTSEPKAVNGPLTIDEGDRVVADVLTRETGAWNKKALAERFPHLVEDILLLKPSITGAEDSYAWLKNASGDYTAKSGYNSLHKNDPTNISINATPATFNWYKSIWNVKALPKIQIFLWKILHNALPSRENL